MENLFTTEKKRILQLLNSIYDKLQQLENKLNLEYGDLLTKISNTIRNIESEKFSIAFFGAFSDGKSTILSALIHRLDIKIAPEPTTDRINTYVYGDYFIIDTPGLFSEFLMHDEKTKKYISEANLVLYVVPPINPLKNSHHPTVKWLLEDLDKKNSIIFVINKMDEVADLTDDEDFKKNCTIKRSVVKDTINSIIKSNIEPVIVCVAADPMQQGLNYWLDSKNINDYYRYSRIQHLKNVIDTYIEKAKDKLINNAGISVIKDSLNTVEEQLKNIKEEVKKNKFVLESQLNEMMNRKEVYERELLRIYRETVDEITIQRKSTLNNISTISSPDEFNTFFKKNFGSDFNIFEGRLKSIIQKQLSRLINVDKATLKQIDSVSKFYETNSKNLSEMLLKAGLRLGDKLNTYTNKEIMSKIFQIRRNSELLKKLIKFKPGGEAVKWASGIASKLKLLGKILGTLGIIISVISDIKSMFEGDSFEREKNKFKESIDEFYNDFVNQDFTYEQFLQDYGENLREIDKMIENIQNNLKMYDEIDATVDEYLRELENIKYEIKKFEVA